MPPYAYSLVSRTFFSSAWAQRALPGQAGTWFRSCPTPRRWYTAKTALPAARCPAAWKVAFKNACRAFRRLLHVARVYFCCIQAFGLAAHALHHLPRNASYYYIPLPLYSYGWMFGMRCAPIFSTFPFVALDGYLYYPLPLPPPYLYLLH